MLLDLTVSTAIMLMVLAVGTAIML
jgi:hypothetical protein